MRLRNFQCLLAVLLLTFSVSTKSTASPSVRVVDGDTIEVNGITYRLFGIDAPEVGQKCKLPGGSYWACGREAVAAMESLVIGHEVICDNRGMDAYDRVLAICKVGDRTINEAMIQMGMAWSFRKYSNLYDALEDEIHTRKVGVWQANTEAPWTYREERWSVAAQAAPGNCPIKGNISSNGHIYHAPWSPWYLKTSINIKIGERWFCSEAEALAAGWRAPYWGRSD